MFKFIFKRLTKNNKGFSLIELMVVVAIIGVLAAVGIPQYSKFQARTRQSEAKLSLASLFTAEASFKGEWNNYTVDLKNAGFGVTGARLRYVVGQAAGTACTGYTTLYGAPAELTTVASTWSDGSFVSSSTAVKWEGGVTITKPTAAGSTGACATNSFTAIAYGNPNQTMADPGATGGDTWSITETKLLTNITSNIQ